MGGVLNLLIGIILLFAVSECRVSWFVTAFGILGLIKGILLFFLSQKKKISRINWWAERPVKFLRVHTVFALVLGTLLIISA